MGNPDEQTSIANNPKGPPIPQTVPNSLQGRTVGDVYSAYSAEQVPYQCAPTNAYQGATQSFPTSGVPAGAYQGATQSFPTSGAPTGAYQGATQSLPTSGAPTGAYQGGTQSLPPTAPTDYGYNGPHTGYGLYPTVPAALPDQLFNTGLQVPSYLAAQKENPNYKPKSLCTAYGLGFPFGFLGAHHFYLGRTEMGIVYLFTFGLLGIGWVVDWFRMPLLVNQVNNKRKFLEPYLQKNVMDAYVLWLPFGLIGFHHYYLRRYHWGLLYTFTFGLLGVGWLLDGLRMPQIVAQTNMELVAETSNLPQLKNGEELTLEDAYILGLSPFGLFGFHHYYMRRWSFAITYTLTFGLLGVGYLVDLCLMPVLIKRARKIREKKTESHVYLDEAYKLWLPFGLFGFHHFYLRRPGCGIFYLFTFGGLGIGWLIDGCRMIKLVQQTNKRLESNNPVLVENPVPQTIQVPPNSHVIRVPADTYIIYPEGGAPGTIHIANPHLITAGIMQSPHQDYGAFNSGNPSISGQYQTYPNQEQGLSPPPYTPEDNIIPSSAHQQNDHIDTECKK